MNENQIASIVVDSCLRVHKALGPGLLESVYETYLERELINRGVKVRRQVGLPVIYDGLKLEDGFRIDLLVEERVIVEVKSVEDLAPVHFKQVLTYLKLSERKLALLVNFNVNLLKEGLKRVVNGLEDRPPVSAPLAELEVVEK